MEIVVKNNNEEELNDELIITSDRVQLQGYKLYSVSKEYNSIEGYVGRLIFEKIKENILDNQKSFEEQKDEIIKDKLIHLIDNLLGYTDLKTGFKNVTDAQEFITLIQRYMELLQNNKLLLSPIDISIIIQKLKKIQLKILSDSILFLHFNVTDDIGRTIESLERYIILNTNKEEKLNKPMYIIENSAYGYKNPEDDKNIKYIIKDKDGNRVGVANSIDWIRV